jgi:hypothetical protein
MIKSAQPANSSVTANTTKTMQAAYSKKIYMRILPLFRLLGVPAGHRRHTLPLGETTKLAAFP